VTASCGAATIQQRFRRRQRSGELISLIKLLHLDAIVRIVRAAKVWKNALAGKKHEVHLARRWPGDVPGKAPQVGPSHGVLSSRFSATQLSLFTGLNSVPLSETCVGTSFPAPNGRWTACLAPQFGSWTRPSERRLSSVFLPEDRGRFKRYRCWGSDGMTRAV